MLDKSAQLPYYGITILANWRIFFPVGTVSDIIKERIRAEIISADVDLMGGRVPSERELQERYQVSRPTINRALGELAAEGLLTRPAGKRQYTIVRGRNTQSIPVRDNQRIGYIVGSLSSGNFGTEIVHRVLTGIHEGASRRGVRVLMGISGESIAGEREAACDLVASGASGLIIFPYPRVGEEIAQDYLITNNIGVPVVLLDNCTPQQGHIQVIFDNRRAGYDLTSWLIRQGHRRIGIISVSQDSQHMPLLSRLAGYREALADQEIDVDPSWIARVPLDLMAVRYRDEARVDNHLSSILDLWAGLENAPTAIVALEDSTAMELITLLSSRGVNVPSQMMVAGFDNLDVARLFKPVFTTTRPDFRRMGELSCQLLLDALATGTTVARTYVLESPIHVRGQAHRPAHSVRAHGGAVAAQVN